MIIKLAPVPKNAARRFAEGWPAYDIPAMWVKPVREWTVRLAEMDPNFKYQQITLKFDTQARVHIETASNNYPQFRELIKEMNRELSLSLPNNRSK